ncbi:kinase-like protein [Tilletiaria anomala UBC 951]|uniref:Kinase-like protein n=1 Tax=Tilletiaria anomala (strain ATCC 24038 / CBS 436.72 / UBC 951) TaxID=1037660 RepID=A0A066VYR0_TILAU|nr:kinase-like protein [Tilletiaria anomala UBC 951]KDN46641.1 kinase-like protein [Tilletiaria anomala UBC 951]
MSALSNASIRKKRNFKGLQLSESPLAIPTPSLTSSAGDSSAGPSSSLASSLSSAAPSDASSSRLSESTNATVRGQTNGLTAGSATAGSRVGGGGVTASSIGSLTGLSTAYSAAGSTATSTAFTLPGSGANYHNKLSEQLASLELSGKNGEVKLDLRNEDLKFLSELGAGNGGTVTKVLHEKSGKVMAKKVVFIDAKPTVRKQILRELQILHECNSKFIVSFYGAYLSEPHICMCMEFMDKKSLDTVYKRWGPIPPEVCGQVAVTVVHGLTYLYDVHRIIHRDVKPSNILVNSQGQIKICDFGVSGELINSIADTFVGTSTYMSPERIQGDQYSVKSDVWSLGVTFIELALGRFPFSAEDEDVDEVPDELKGTLSPTRPTPHAEIESAKERARRRRSKGGVTLEGSNAQMSILDLLQHIVNEPSPKLPDWPDFSKLMHDFSAKCLLKDPEARPSPKDLLSHAYIKQSEQSTYDVVAWVQQLD